MTRLLVRRKPERTIRENRKLQQSVTEKSTLDYETTESILEELREKPKNKRKQNKHLTLSQMEKEN